MWPLIRRRCPAGPPGHERNHGYEAQDDQCWNTQSVGNQQKWDTFVKERSGGNGGVPGLP